MDEGLINRLSLTDRHGVGNRQEPTGISVDAKAGIISSLVTTATGIETDGVIPIAAGPISLAMIVDIGGAWLASPIASARIMPDDTNMAIRNFLKEHQIRADLRQLRESHELDRIIREAKAMGITFDQAPNYPDVVAAAKEMGKDQSLVPVYLSETNKALWWIVTAYRLKNGVEVDESFTFLIKSALRGQFVDPVTRFLERSRMKSELRELRRSGELDRFLEDADYEIIRGDQGSDFIHVYHKEDLSLGAELFSAYSRDEVICWVMKRTRKDKEIEELGAQASINKRADDHAGRD